MYANERQVHSYRHSQSTCREHAAASYLKLFRTPNESWIGCSRYCGSPYFSQRKTTGTHSITENLGRHNRLIPAWFCPCIASRDNAWPWSSHHTQCKVNPKYMHTAVLCFIFLSCNQFFSIHSESLKSMYRKSHEIFTLLWCVLFCYHVIHWRCCPLFNKLPTRRWS